MIRTFAVLLRRVTMSVRVDQRDISEGWMGGVRKVTEFTKVVCCTSFTLAALAVAISKYPQDLIHTRYY